MVSSVLYELLISHIVTVNMCISRVFHVTVQGCSMWLSKGVPCDCPRVFHVTCCNQCDTRYVISHIVTVNMRTSLSVNISYCRTSACAYQRSLSSHFLISPGVSMRMDAWLGCIRVGCWVFHFCLHIARGSESGRGWCDDAEMAVELVDILRRLDWWRCSIILGFV